MITARELAFHFRGKKTFRRPHLTAILEPGTQAYVPVNVENMVPEYREALVSEPPYVIEKPEPARLPCRCYNPNCREDHNAD